MQTLRETKETMDELSTENELNIMSMINKVSAKLHSYSKRLTKNEFDANDLYQDTVLMIISKSEKYNLNINFKAWAMTIMKNIFISSCRRKKRLRAILCEPRNVSILKSESSTTINEGESKMAYVELLRKLSSLPENFKRPFWMYYKGYQYKEIADLLDVPTGTIKSRIFFARRTMQAMCKQAG